ncbi:SpoIID/LytB domain-containing protein [Candidatus Dojkabacteria bacterium]|nr:SpoIID/LytB domain-containing protein [Candidatus Dojkabacteria bacterium]
MMRRFRLIILWVGLLALLSSITLDAGAVFADDSTDDQIEEKENEKTEKQSDLENSEALEYQYLQEGLTLSQQLAALQSDLANIETEIDDIDKNLDELELQISEKEKELDEKKDEYHESSRSLYKLSQVNMISMMLSSNGLEDIVYQFSAFKFKITNTLDQLNGVTGLLTSLNGDYEDIQQSLETKQSNLDQLAQDKVALENQQKLLEQKAASEYQKQKDLISQIAGLEDEISNLTQEAKDAIGEKIGGGEELPDVGGGDTGGGTSPQDPEGEAGSYDIYKNGQLIVQNATGPIRFVPTSASYFSVDSGLGKYRGILEFRADTNVYLINELDLELYLRGIGEMPSSWPLEALKVQAVAARTYAAANWNKRINYGYNLRDDTYDQNYVGYSKEIASYGNNWVTAVNATDSQVIYSGGSLISAYYHSTCGGHTLSSQEVWGGNLSYAQAKSDWYNNGSGWVSYDSVSPWSYKRWGSANIGMDGVSGLTDLVNAAIWLEINSASSVSQNNVIRPDLGPGWDASTLSANLGGNSITSKVGTITSVTHIYNNGSSSIDSSVKSTTALRITGTSGSYDVTGAMFRLAFNLRSPGDDVLWSSLWDVKNEGGSWNFYSRGYPHRVGMCQYGAYGRALAGQDYSSIISHYYNGVNVGNFSPPSNFRVGITQVGGTTTFISADGNFDIYANGQKVASGGSGQNWSVVKK